MIPINNEIAFYAIVSLEFLLDDFLKCQWGGKPMNSKKSPKRPYGRSLVDLDIGPNEVKLLEKIKSGKPYWGEVDQEGKPTKTFKAEFLRFIALGGDDDNPIPEMGIEIFHVTVEGSFDLSGTTESRPLFLRNCVFLEKINLRGATLNTFSLKCSKTKEIDALGTRFLGYVALLGNENEPFVACGEVNLISATVKGDIYCQRGRFINPKGKAIFADRIEVGGSVYLSKGFEARGSVRFLGARISHDLVCSGGRFEINRRGSAERIGNNDGAGSVLSLPEARISGRLYLGKGPTPSDQSTTRPESSPISDKPVTFKGSINLLGAQVGELVDDESSWPKCTIEKNSESTLKGYMLLEGFTYNYLAEASPTSWRKRKNWISLQPQHLPSPQPYEQLANALSAMGYECEARKVRIAKRAHLNKHRRNRFRSFSSHSLDKPTYTDYVFSNIAFPFRWLSNHISYILIGYRYRPHGVVGLMILMWFISAQFYSEAWKAGIFAPTDSYVYLQEKLNDCRARENKSWYQCRNDLRLQEYTSFSPYWYSTDLILGPINLQQEAQWEPMIAKFDYHLSLLSMPFEVPDYATRLVVLLEIIIGWLGGGFLVAYLTGIIRRN